MCQAAVFCRGWAKSENLESLQADKKRETIFHKNSIPPFDISRIIHRIHLFLHLLQLGSELLKSSRDFLLIFTMRPHLFIVLVLS